MDPITENRFYRTLNQIPKGKVSTYKAIAQVFKINPRFVGYLLKNNQYPDKYACYKIVKSDGTTGGYAGKYNNRDKIKKLRQDGIEIQGNRIKNFAKVLFVDFKIS
ncbi:MAG: cysteine methyltransferase [Candidatus Moranbacteria bacterium]|nr:cysteine methyltransferase [Candidatus Moranbacteria bacterium]